MNNKLIILIVACILVAGGLTMGFWDRLFGKKGDGGTTRTGQTTGMSHDAPPQLAPTPHPDVLAAMKRMQESSYTPYVEELRPLVTGKTVVGSQVGKSGFILLFDDKTWAAAYVGDDQLKWATGTGDLTGEQLALLDSPACGDGRPKLPDDGPYANEECDLKAEVAKAHGKPVTGLAIGEGTFDFCFPDGRELDASIRKDADGKPVLRVFWEQW